MSLIAVPIIFLLCVFTVLLGFGSSSAFGSSATGASSFGFGTTSKPSGSLSAGWLVCLFNSSIEWVFFHLMVSVKTGGEQMHHIGSDAVCGIEMQLLPERVGYTLIIPSLFWNENISLTVELIVSASSHYFVLFCWWWENESMDVVPP